jgi:hypothetical protein
MRNLSDRFLDIQLSINVHSRINSARLSYKVRATRKRKGHFSSFSLTDLLTDYFCCVAFSSYIPLIQYLTELTRISSTAKKHKRNCNSRQEVKCKCIMEISSSFPELVDMHLVQGMEMLPTLGCQVIILSFLLTVDSDRRSSSTECGGMLAVRFLYVMCGGRCKTAYIQCQTSCSS